MKFEFRLKGRASQARRQFLFLKPRSFSDWHTHLEEDGLLRCQQRLSGRHISQREHTVMGALDHLRLGRAVQVSGEFSLTHEGSSLKSQQMIIIQGFHHLMCVQSMKHASG